MKTNSGKLSATMVTLAMILKKIIENVRLNKEVLVELNTE